MESEKLVKVPTTPSSKSGPRHTNENSTIYIHSNDPKVVSKGYNVDVLRHSEGGVLPYITDVPYDQRLRPHTINPTYSNKTDHGSRPMHQSSLVLNPQVIKPEYSTHNQKVYQGFQLSYDLSTKVTAMHQMNHQFKIGVNDSVDHTSYYKTQFFKKNNNEFNERKKENHENYVSNRKSNVEEVLNLNPNDTNYWSEYKRYHNYLGYLRGPGVSREFPDRKSYNALTGKTEKPSWSINDNYKRVSGNVILNSIRKQPENILN